MNSRPLGMSCPWRSVVGSRLPLRTMWLHLRGAPLFVQSRQKEHSSRSIISCWFPSAGMSDNTGYLLSFHYRPIPCACCSLLSVCWRPVHHCASGEGVLHPPPRIRLWGFPFVLSSALSPLTEYSGPSWGKCFELFWMTQWPPFLPRSFLCPLWGVSIAHYPVVGSAPEGVDPFSPFGRTFATFLV